MKYRQAERSAAVALPELIDRTFPNIRDEYSGRLEVEERLSRSLEFLTSAEREALIWEPFKILGPEAEHGPWDDPGKRREVLALVLSLLCLLVFGGKVIQFLFHADDVVSVNAAVLLMLSGIVMFTARRMMAPGRWLRQSIMPRLAASLRPLHLTREELRATLQRLATADRAIGKKVSADRLWALLKG